MKKYLNVWVERLQNLIWCNNEEQQCKWWQASQQVTEEKKRFVIKKSNLSVLK